MNKEEWKSVYGFEDTYLINKDGEVLAVDKMVNAAYGSKQLRKQHFMKIHTNNKGYFYFSPYTKRKYFIHKCIYEAFVGPIPEGYDLHHINHNHQDNRLENLCLIPSSKHRSMHCKETIERIKHKISKPVLQFTVDGELVAEYESLAEAERQTGIRPHMEGGKYKSSGGYLWCYKGQENLISEKVKANREKGVEKDVVQYTRNMEFVAEYKSITDAANNTNLELKNISAVCRGKRKTCGGYIWKYKEVA